MRLKEYISTLPITQGRNAGERFFVMPWQARFLRGIEREGVRTAALSLGRAGGKSTLTSAIACAGLVGPLAVPRAETVVCASSFAQGKIIFDHVLAFLRDIIEVDRRRWRIQDSANVASITDQTTGCKVRCIGSDPKRAHGLAPALVLLDEPAQWPDTTGERMLAALRTGLGKQPWSLLIALGTRPDSPEHWFEKMLAGGADYSQCHAANEDDPPFQRRTWLKANPGMRYMPDLEEAIRAEALEAKRDPVMLSSFRALRLNLGTSDVRRQYLLMPNTWKQIEGNAAKTGPTVWGIDLGGSAAMSAITCHWTETGRLESLAAFPSDPDLRDRGLHDGVDRLYLDCANAGELITTGGRAVAVKPLVEAALSRFGLPDAILADRWREDELFDALQALGIHVRIIPRGMGFKDGGEDVRLFRHGCLGGNVTPVKSLLMRSAMGEAMTISDPAGNEKLAKNAGGGRRMRARDDAAAAAILAVAEGERRRSRPVRKRRFI
ncbi:MAG: terminase large subunit [Gammaproteobacteria bacterium]|nr:terminase large subunit [Gammaproteobacteria bacterium]